MEHGSVLEFRNPDPRFQDHLTEIIRSGCQQIIEAAVETELRVFLDYYQDAKEGQVQHEFRGRLNIVRRAPLNQLKTHIFTCRYYKHVI